MKLCPRCSNAILDMRQELDPMGRPVQFWHCSRCNHRWTET
ncbi:hypothetical protein [Candidatus Hecatella orcuttiae]|nr:hypothetical protein [Candidatus Hecatella orcuttiae]